MNIKALITGLAGMAIIFGGAVYMRKVQHSNVWLFLVIELVGIAVFFSALRYPHDEGSSRDN